MKILKNIVVQAEGSLDSSKVGDEGKTLMSEEERLAAEERRLAEEHARRRQEELVRVSTRYSSMIIQQKLLIMYKILPLEEGNIFQACICD